MAENVSRLMIEVTSDGVIKAADNLDELTTAGKKSEVQAEKTARGIKKIDKAAAATKGSFGSMKGATQNVSYQLQDIAVQAQMGTSAFIILGQQGPQLASIFGPGGAVFGALIAFGSMIGGVLYASMNKAKVSSDDLKDALIRLDATVVKSKNSTYELSKRILELANVSSKGAQAELISGIQDTTDVIKGAQTSIEGLIETESGMRFGGLASSLERLKQKDININDLLKIDSYSRNIMELDRFAESVEKLQKTYKLTVPQAFSLAEAMGSLDPKDASTYLNLRNTIDDIASVSGLSSVEFKRFRQSVVDGANSIDEAEKKATLLGTALGIVKENGTAALAPLIEGAKDATKALNEADQARMAALLDADIREAEILTEKEKRETAAALKAEEREIASAEKRLLSAEAANDNEIEAIRRKSIEQQQILERDRVLAVARAEKEGADVLAVNERYMEAHLALEAGANEKIAEINAALNAQKLNDQATYMSDWMALTKESMMSMDLLGFQMATSLQSNLGNAFESFLTGASSAKEAFKDLATGMAKSLIHALSNMAAEWVAYYLVEKAMGKAGQASAGVAMGFNALAGQQMAAINAFASTAAIPVVGPALAPAASAAAIAATAPFVAATMSLSAAATGARALGGQVRGGESYLVGERGPELLTMGTSGRIATNENLKNAVGGGGGVTVINNIDATGSGPDVETKIRAAMDQTSAKTIATIQDLMRRRRFA